MIGKISAVLFVLICIVIYGLWTEYNRVLIEPVVIQQPQLLKIEKGESFNQISKKLVEQKIAIKPLWFKLIAYEKQVINKLKAGEYDLKVGLTMPELLEMFVKGKIKQYSITFPEGWSYKQIIQQIQNNPHLIKTLKSNDYQGLMSRLNAKHTHPEGQFFPDTYFFDSDTTDFALLKTAYDKMQRVLTEEWANKAQKLPLEDAYQVLILASIIEKETGAGAERAQISGVFTRRLRKGMKLQTDPTVIYGMGDSYKGDIRYRDLRKATPYNTYVIKGLPPTPIAMPGRAAIHAAAHPEQGDSLFFVSRGDGTHIFSATLKQHNRAVNKYQKKK